eukprot:TRINITY_DN33874_c0_g1_i1.p1 TRINITY_DN33874_c0_g1~~TRINITY_DN33874_c0_g1_i1.p1  ORF type:complete len:539 (-),score=110.13 TRINITY_DN33874_c0_g1_i1:51-1667(-)
MGCGRARWAVFAACASLELICLHCRPIDNVAAWLHVGESICWVLSPSGDYEGCCAWKFGRSGNTACWFAAPLSYEACCLERWTACDLPPEDVVAATAAGGVHAVFFAACGAAQRLANAVFAAGAGLAEEGALSLERLNVELQRFRAGRAELAHQAMQELSPSGESRALRMALRDWPPVPIEVAITDALKYDVSAGSAWILGHLQRLHKTLFEHVVGLRDHLLDVLYSKELEQMTRGCGEICSTTPLVQRPPDASSWPLPRKAFQCDALLESVGEFSARGPVVPPPAIPPSLRKFFIMDGNVSVVGHSAIREALGFAGGGMPEKILADPGWQWTEDDVEQLIALARNGTLAPGPGSLERVNALGRILRDLPRSVQGQRWLVWGDSKFFEWWRPWMEALLLSLGAAEVTSLVPEPARYIDHRRSWAHPRLRAATLLEAAAGRHWKPFDGVVLLGAASAGTGRHGDRLNPFADLQYAAAAWCLLRPATGLLLAPPVPSDDAKDLLRWPSGRAYGAVRWPHLVSNFELLASYDGVAAVLRKP